MDEKKYKENLRLQTYLQFHFSFFFLLAPDNYVKVSFVGSVVFTPRSRLFLLEDPFIITNAEFFYDVDLQILFFVFFRTK